MPQKIFRSLPILCLMFLGLLSGCESLKKGLSKAVLMDYDQTNNFRQYRFENGTYIDWGGGASEWGVSGGWDGTSGFWVAFLICNLRNESSKAETFTMNKSKFYVEYDGKKHYHKPLDTYTYSSLPHGLPGNPTVNPVVNEKIRVETQLGPNTDSFQKGYYPTVNYRVLIYVTKTSPGPVDTSTPLLLRYEGYPNILNPRNQPPYMTGANPTRKADLKTTCRPAAG